MKRLKFVIVSVCVLIIGVAIGILGSWFFWQRISGGPSTRYINSIYESFITISLLDSQEYQRILFLAEGNLRECIILIERTWTKENMPPDVSRALLEAKQHFQNPGREQGHPLEAKSRDNPSTCSGSADCDKEIG